MTASTTVSGGAKWDSCWREAAYMAMHVYFDPAVPDTHGPHPPTANVAAMNAYLQQRRRHVDANWEEWDDLDEHTSTGLVARLFKLKRWTPGDAEAPPCPPTLAFRGTDFDDMRDVAIVAHVGLGIRPIRPFSSTPTILWDKDWGLTRDRAIGENPTPEVLAAAGWTRIPIYQDQGTAQAEMANFGIHLAVGVELRLDLYAKDSGDWLANLMQGLGRTTNQFENAKTFGRQQVRSKILSVPDPTLELTGHSLGGSLASAVCTVLDHEFPEVRFHAVVFNSAGVHANTVTPAALGSATIHNFTVRNEALTTAQSFTSQLPILGAIFNLAQRELGQWGLPPALGTRLVEQGKNPPGSAFGAAGTNVPRLFPIADQQASPGYTGRFPILTQIDQLLNGSASATQFGNRFLTWLNTNYRARALGSADSTLGLVFIWNLYQEMGRLLLADAEPEIEALKKVGEAAIAYHGMAYVIAAYEAKFGGP